MGNPTSVIPVATADGTRFELRSFTCEAPRAAVLIVPAMGVAAKFYDRLAEAFAGSAVAAHVSELRGIGSSDQRASRAVDFGYRELVDLDLVAAVKSVKNSAPELPLFVVGHSLGGHVALLFAALHGDEIAGAAVVAGGTPYYRNWEFPMNAFTLFGSSLMRGLGLALGYVPGNRIGFGGREANRVVAEWARFVRSGKLVVEGLERSVVEGKLSAATVRLLGVSLEEDNYAPRIAVDRLVAMLPSARLTRVHLERGVVGPNVDHFRWAKQPKVVVDVVTAWIDGALE